MNYIHIIYVYVHADIFVVIRIRISFPNLYINAIKLL